MARCFRQNFVLHKMLVMCKSTTSLKFFSSFSPVYDRINSSNFNSYQYPYKKPKAPFKQVQCRYFFMEGLQVYSDIISHGNGIYETGKQLLIEAHDFTGMSWWATIFSAAAAMKILVSFPCGVCQQFIVSKLELSKRELNTMTDNIKHKILLEAKTKKWTQKMANLELNREMRKQWSMIVVKNNCHPFKNFILFLFQLPVWLLMTLSIRKFADDANAVQMVNPVAELQFLVGGPFWCQNMAMPDPLYILPTLNALTILAINEINFLYSDLKAGHKKRNFLFSKIIPNLLRFLAVVVFFASSASPSGISLFWATSSFFALLQNLLLMSPRVRRLLRIPKSPSDLSKPYSQVWFAFVEKLSKLFLRK